MIEISERADITSERATVKDVKLEELFPWLNPKTPNLDDFFAQATIRLEEIRAYLISCSLKNFCCLKLAPPRPTNLHLL
jgi:hypothetical protein